jgi:hypothetical protein
MGGVPRRHRRVPGWLMGWDSQRRLQRMIAGVTPQTTPAHISLLSGRLSLNV